MSHHHFHWLEKVIVQIAAVVSLAGGYFLLYPAVRPADGQTALSLLVAGGVGHAMVFAAGVVVLAIFCGVLTLPARPSSAILAAAIGAGGVSLRSADFRTLLWLQQDGFAGLFRLLIAETMFLAVVLLVAVLIVVGIRFLAGRMAPWLVWRPMPLAAPPDDKTGLVGGLGPWGRSLVSAALALLIGLAAVMILLQSSRRGQVVVATLAAFALAAWIADRVLPAPRKGMYLLAPLTAAIIFYALASVGAYGSRPEDWINVPLYARVLPVDWLTAGCGGAMLGCWTGQRMAEVRILEQPPEDQKGHGRG
ncbi:MAG: hypothetical protein ABSH10_01210 [Phycisphaerae bacterium]|jgi:hypothetical protein